MTYLTDIHDLPVPDQLPPDIGPDVPKDLRDLADSIDSKLTPYSQGNGTPADLGIAPGKPGRRHRNATTGDEYLDIGAAWVLSTPQANPAAGVAGLRTLGVGALEAAAGNDARLSDDRNPIDGSVTAAKIAATLKPSGGAAAATEALRALGVVAGTAAAGNDARLSDQRTPVDGSVTSVKLATDLTLNGRFGIGGSAAGPSERLAVALGVGFGVRIGPVGNDGSVALILSAQSDNQKTLVLRPTANPQTDIFAVQSFAGSTMFKVDKNYELYTDIDPDTESRQHGVAQGGAITWINANTIRVAAGKGWVQQASGLLRKVKWVQTDVNIPNAANTRLDQITVSSAGTVTRLPGLTDVAGATLDNRNGADPWSNPGVGSVLRLVDVVATAAGVANSAAGFRDRRPSASGARRVLSGTPNPGGNPGFAKSYSPATNSLIDASLQGRVECSGKPIRVRFWTGNLQSSAVAYVSFFPWVDGAILPNTEGYSQVRIEDSSDGEPGWFLDHEFTPAAGSHTFGPGWLVSGTGGSTPTATVFSRNDFKSVCVIEEIMNPMIIN
jgi:hypothetical protein